MKPYIIRRVEPDDAQDIFHLHTSCGYIYDVEKVRKRIINVLETGSDLLMIMELNGTIIGYVHGTPYNTLYTDHILNLVAIIFSSVCDYEMQEALYDAFKHQAIKHGYCAIRFTADIHHMKIHAFLIDQGFVFPYDTEYGIQYFI